MSRTIKRGSPPRRAAPRAKPAAPKPSIMDRLVHWLPVSEEMLARAVTWTITGAAAAIAVGAAMWFGVPAMAGNAIARGAATAGFRVEQIEVTGLKRMDRMSVYAVALEDKQNATPMLAVDLDAIRQRLLRYGWIADAHVSRRLPDTLLIAIDERVPAAVWQDRGQLTLIDSTGVLLEPVRADAVPDLPIVIGPGADRQEAAYQALLATAPRLKSHVTAATWVGNRRWDLTFESGETLLLPEDGAAKALETFAKLDGSRLLLGRGWLRFDMRDPDKLVARKPGASAVHAVGEPVDTNKAVSPQMAAASDREG